MLIVRVELHSARTGLVTEIGRMSIANTGRGTPKKGEYFGKAVRGRYGALTRDQIREAKAFRTGEVKDYPRQSKHVWNLVARMLKAMGYE